MKKLLSLLLVLSLAGTLAACSDNTGADPSESDAADELSSTVEEASASESQPDESGGEEPADASASQTDAQPATGKTLVVYMSHTGTTAAVADHITEAIDADVFVILPTNAYPSSYNEHLEVAQQELNADVRPDIQSSVANMDEYDTILLGYPIWWGYAPRPVATFLQSYDLSGKTIAPFCTSGSSGMGQSAEEIAGLAPGADMVSGLSITGSDAGNEAGLVRDWLAGLGLL